MNTYYVVTHPAKVGNFFGSYGHVVPEGRYVVVKDGEYSNGGHGPSVAVNYMFKTQERAECAARAMNANGDMTADEAVATVNREMPPV
jgi:hypothetical protein